MGALSRREWMAARLCMEKMKALIAKSGVGNA